MINKMMEQFRSPMWICNLANIARSFYDAHDFHDVHFVTTPIPFNMGMMMIQLITNNKIT
jgi:hypothetical protein